MRYTPETRERQFTAPTLKTLKDAIHQFIVSPDVSFISVCFRIRYAKSDREKQYAASVYYERRNP